ncbi:hypothetical protein ACFXPV_27955 [Streptomyces sp. NPDC059118]|uniref:hypothetical protein n=1 Tax=unclassified Streptomyces TaxID=2593676 RepID=UPI0036CE10F7
MPSRSRWFAAKSCSAFSTLGSASIALMNSGTWWPRNITVYTLFTALTMYQELLYEEL